MRRFLVLAIALTFAACQSSSPAKLDPVPTSTIGYSDTDGLTKASAIVITGAHNGSDGVGAVYDWIDEHFPGSTIESQKIEGGDGIYDVMTLTLTSGETRIVYFNITSFMHKR